MNAARRQAIAVAIIGFGFVAAALGLTLRTQLAPPAHPQLLVDYGRPQAPETAP